MDIGIRVPACRPLDEMAEFLRVVEGAGFGFAGLLDSQLVTRDAYLTCLAGLAGTRNLALYTAVTNPITRHASVIASAAMTVHEVARGRFGVIIGSGNSSAKTIGRPPATLAEMEGTITAIRALFRGEDVPFGATASHLEFGDRVGPPIIMAATGPRMLRLAGKVADGVLIAVGSNSAAIAEAIRQVRDGAAAAGRDPAEVRIMVSARIILGTDTAAAQRFARPLCAQWLTDSFRRRWIDTSTLGIDLDRLTRDIAHVYPDIVHAEDWEGAIESTAAIPDEALPELCDALGIIGSSEYVARRLAGFESESIDTIYLMGLDSYDLPHSIVDQFGREIAPALAGRTP
jgi:5,10-methylenetetrahydromethanopterin reductase